VRAAAVAPHARCRRVAARRTGTHRSASPSAPWAEGVYGDVCGGAARARQHEAIRRDVRVPARAPSQPHAQALGACDANAAGAAGAVQRVRRCARPQRVRGAQPVR
jgi:hypothetical protein